MNVTGWGMGVGGWFENDVFGYKLFVFFMPVVKNLISDGKTRIVFLKQAMN